MIAIAGNSTRPARCHRNRGNSKICDTKGTVVYDDYFAINIVGKVAAADLGKSVSDSEQSDSMISRSFDALAVDGHKARGLKLFRLAENVGVVLVSEDVKTALDAQNLATIELLQPEQIAAL